MTRLPFALLTLSICLAGSASATEATVQPAADSSTATGLTYDPKSGTFTEPLPPPGGWQAFANLLAKITPSVNTAVPLTPSQITNHIAALITAGKAEAALTLIAQRSEARARSGAIGTDVQLEYQRGRALEALGRYDQALAVWRQMTTDFPELPEPWNALAIEYARQGALNDALEALNMALVSVPDFAPALENRGHVQMQLAQESFARARAVRQGAGASGAPAAKTGKRPPPAAK